jgi:O-antigen/teichoic acid export membrane protein
LAQGQLLNKTLIAARLVTILRISVTGISLGSQFILARLLAPASFGQLVFLLFVLDLAGRITSLQSEKGIIRDQEDPQQALHAYFTFEGILSVSVALVLLFSGPTLMQVLGKPILALPLQIGAGLLIFRWLRAPLILAKKELDFHVVTRITLIGELIKPTVSIFLAWNGFGFWSLLWGLVAYEISQVILIWIWVPFRPRWIFERSRAFEMLRFALPLSASGLLSYWYWRIDDFWVGKLLGDEQLGYYWMAFTIPHTILGYVENLDRVTYPAFAKAENDAQIIRGFELVTRFSAIVLFFPAIASFLWAEPIITLLFGDKWLPAIVPFQIFMLLIVFRGTFRHWANIAILKGKTNIFLIVVAASAISVTGFVYWLTPLYGIIGTAVGVVIAMLGVSPIYFIWFKRILPISYLPAIWKPIVASVVALLIGTLLRHTLGMTDPLFVSLSIAITGIVYLMLIFLLDKEIVGLIRSRIFSRLDTT